jgi:hypothetical protein
MFPRTTLKSVCNSQFPHHGEFKSGCDGERGAGSSMILEKGISLAFAHDHGEDIAVLLVEMYRQIEFRALRVSLGFSLTFCYPENFHGFGPFAFQVTVRLKGTCLAELSFHPPVIILPVLDNGSAVMGAASCDR